jgi:hypothetical protein
VYYNQVGRGLCFLPMLAARVEFTLVGVTELVLGLFALLGVVGAKSVKQSVHWTAQSTLLWHGSSGRPALSEECESTP